MRFWDKLLRSKAKPEPEAPPLRRAEWLAADAPGNPFGVQLLDLMITQEFIGSSRELALERPKTVREGSWHIWNCMHT